MWLKIGSYPEMESAAEIASKLSDAGARIEIKVYADWDLEEKYILRGKLSEIKKYDYEEVKEWERYVEIIRSILTYPMPLDEFEKKFLEEAHPYDYNLAKKVYDVEISEDEFFEAAESAFKLSILMSSIYGFLKVNGVRVDDYVSGTLPEDPEVVIELEEEVEGSQKLYVLSFVPVWDVYVDVLSLIGTKPKLDGEEGTVVDAAARILANVAVKAEEVSDIDELREYCGGVIEAESTSLDGDVIVDGEEIFDEIIKSLEKAGIVRVTGNKIRRRK